ncbi:hypothetical protein [Clostridium sp. KNHs205]|uniref:hypothetical protein n=1 Tax=Clostridium sp. KNHs205 TaxID=1449050 RepID=UPI00051BB378|nr:hypothetical protein [Clostridium sp. KNHs205]
MTGLELAFEEDMRYICREAIKIGYRPRVFAEMLTIKGGLITAKQLVMQDNPTEGFTKLYEKNRLDLTAEAFIIKAKYKELFTEEEIQISYNRLKEYGYNID